MPPARAIRVVPGVRMIALVVGDLTDDGVVRMLGVGCAVNVGEGEPGSAGACDGDDGTSDFWIWSR